MLTELAHDGGGRDEQGVIEELWDRGGVPRSPLALRLDLSTDSTPARRFAPRVSLPSLAMSSAASIVLFGDLPLAMGSCRWR